MKHALQAVLVVVAMAGAALAQEAGLDVRVLSGKPDMVSGGDALVQITGAANASVTVNARDVTGAFRPGKVRGSLVGRIEGLADGRNTLEVRRGATVRRLDLVNYPRSGPIFSGPHQKPFICETESAGLGPALDANCSARPVTAYFYKPAQPVSTPASAPGPAATTAPAGFKPYDPASTNAADVAKTTMSDGRTVDFIVRRETGTINRAIYQIAFLHRPGDPLPDPWSAGSAWNGRLVYTFGGGCRAGYRQASPGGGADAAAAVALAGGYAVATSSLNVFGNDCNDVISAETVMMVKEYFTERFGVPVHTIGAGPSGGSMQLHLIAQNYPGLIDGLLPTVSYPDITSIIPGVVDCSLLDRAFANSQQSWTDVQKTAVSGYPLWGTCATSWFNSAYSPGWVRAAPTGTRATTCDAVIPRELVYDAVSNPSGARCGVYDTQANLYGRDPKTGFARRPLDNVGVQYGLKAFNAGTITADQFVELNERIGGFDADGNIVAARSAADPVALRIAYQTGRVNTGSGGLPSTPIIDLRPYVDLGPDIHDRFRSFVTRARLLDANGRADNHVILTLPGGENGLLQALTPEHTAEVLRAMNQWLDNIAGDRSRDDAAAKVARNKPKDLADGCWTADGDRIVEPQIYGGPGRCNRLYPAHADPRMVAGAPLRDDVLKCTLKPIDPADYARPLGAEQMARLKAAFPEGVCDYNRRGIEQQRVTETWRRY